MTTSGQAIQSAIIVAGGRRTALLTNANSSAATGAAAGTDAAAMYPTSALAPTRLPPPPALLFIHGWAAGKGIWVGLMQRLGSGRLAYALDLPGHGGSDPLSHGYTLDALASEVIRALDALGIRDCVVVGHSMGTLVALTLALVRREDGVVRGLVLCNPPHPTYLRRMLGPWRNDRLLAAMLDLARRTYRVLGWRAPATTPGLIAAFRRRAEAYGAVPTAVLLETVRMLQTADFTSRLADLRIPTLVILGRYDLLAPARGGRLVAEDIPGYHLKELPTGHEALETHEALLAEVIGGWLAERGW